MRWRLGNVREREREIEREHKRVGVYGDVAGGSVWGCMHGESRRNVYVFIMGYVSVGYARV